MKFEVEMDYIGGILSDNSYKFPSGGTRPLVKLWMKDLARKVRGLDFNPKVKVKLYGKFWDGRHPDLSNLHKVIGDALEMGLSINDKHFLFEDEGYELGHFDPKLVISIEEVR